MAMALSQAHAHREANAAHVRALRDKLIEGLLCVPHSVLCGDRIHRLPGNVHMCFEGVEGEALLLMLDAEGICASLRLCLYVRLAGTEPCAVGDGAPFIFFPRRASSVA